MYQLKRISKVPNSPMRIQIRKSDGVDAGLTAGGSWFFMPAGEDGDTHDVGEHAARVVMGDASLAVHFECTPALDPVPVAADEPAKDQAGQGDTDEAGQQETAGDGQTKRRATKVPKAGGSS